MATSFADLDTDFDAIATDDQDARIRRMAHVVHGGEAKFTCKACNGSGQFRSYTGRIVGNCFKCKGVGSISGRQVAAQKGQQTRKENDRIFRETHRAEIEYMRNAANNGFRMMARLVSKLDDNGRLNQDEIDTVRKYMQQDEERKVARVAERAKKKEDAAVDMDLSGIHALFATAVDNKVKKPIFRTEEFNLSKAPMHGRNAGAIYVTARVGNTEYGDDAYLGKVMNGKFYATEWAPKDAAEKLIAIAKDPLAESIKYARRTGRCGCCGHTLVDPVSILAGIGPICAENYGLNYRRELASDEYAEMKAEEAGQKEMKI